MPSHDTTALDEDGDLQLEIISGGDKCGSLLVSSKALSMTSSVFRHMLFGGFAESKPAHGEWKATVHDDDIHCVLNIIHLTSISFFIASIVIAYYISLEISSYI
jgi:hypothetical protein